MSDKRAMTVNWLLGEIFGDLMEERDITEISINRPGEIWCERDNKWERHERPSVVLEQLNSFATAVAAFDGKDISDTRPILSSVLPGMERIQIVRAPACEHGTMSVTIRKPSEQIYTFEDYREQGFFDNIKPQDDGPSDLDRELIKLKNAGQFGELMSLAVKDGKNIVVSGETGSGKTTCMKAMMQHIPTHERIVTIEDVSELFLPNHPNHVHLFYQAERSSDTSSDITPTDLLKCSLRMKPDRIMLAELRGGETYDFLNVVASGHGGSITSCHAGSCALTFERLALMVLQNTQGRQLPVEVIRRLLTLVIDIVIHVNNDTVTGKGRHMTGIWIGAEQC